ncbi:MAG: VWA domain-containing protein [Planctomycetota bacterium]|nr:VWA domain-containing protein [Planctomycetota bacterium]
MPRLHAFAAAVAISAPLALLASPPGSEPASGKLRISGTAIITKEDAQEKKQEKKAARAPRIDLCLLLDTSNSMDGLINQARAQLWKVVNDLAKCRKDGKSPELRVALYEYGNQGLPSDGGWVRQVLPLTDNLDDISEKLFALTTNGGDEYCGRVIEAATQGLEWSKNDRDLKLIVIAGNEPFTQGPVDYKKACGAAVAKGIVVNTIFCGPRSEGITTQWEDGAKIADGTYSNIDQNQQIAEIRTPFDDDLSKLSVQINGTFLFFGRAEERESLSLNQAAQDSNAAGLGGAIAADRAATKGGRAYRFRADLVQEVAENEAALKEIQDEELPEPLQGKSENEKKAIVKQKAAERDALQKKIADLSQKRDAYIAEERKKQVAAGEKDLSLDAALIGALREQAEKKDFSFE